MPRAAIAGCAEVFKARLKDLAGTAVQPSVTPALVQRFGRDERNRTTLEPGTPCRIEEHRPNNPRGI